MYKNKSKLPKIPKTKIVPKEAYMSYSQAKS